MLEIKQGQKKASIEALAGAIQASGIVPKEKWRFIKGNLAALKRSHERFGEVDLDNAQQVALVAYRMRVRYRAPKPELRWVPKGIRPYKLVIVGAGSTAAYYLDTLGPAHDKRNTLVIGGENPWIDKRGHAIPFINHTSRQIALPSKNEVTYAGNESFVLRQGFGRQMTDRIKALAGKVLDDLVTKIERATFGSLHYMKLQCKNHKDPIYADRVVFVAGSGKELKPSPQQMPENNGRRVIHMNDFIRSVARARKPRDASVVIWGSNAAIDAVAAARRYGWNIKAWLMSGQPAWLPGTRYKNRPYSLQQTKIVKYANSSNLRIEDDGQGLKIKEVAKTNADRGLDNDKTYATKVGYLVYGISSEDLLQDVLDDNVLDGEALAPILDVAGIFSDPREEPSEHANDPAKAFLGWGTKDGMLQVFGLAAENYEYAFDAKTGRGIRITLNDPKVMALKRWLSGDVLTVGQLSYIRSALRAVNNYVPGSIEHRVDFSHADANQLRVHLAARYPHIPEMIARWFIGMLRDLRSNDAKLRKNQIANSRLPHGFTKIQVARIENALRQLDVLGRLHAQKIEKADEIAEELHLKGTPLSFEQRLGGLTRIDVRFRSIRQGLVRSLVTLAPEEGVEVQRALAKIPRDER